MTWTCNYPKARVQRAKFPLDGELCWAAARPGLTYFFRPGLHFYRWIDAMAYVTAPGCATCNRRLAQS